MIQSLFQYSVSKYCPIDKSLNQDGTQNEKNCGNYSMIRFALPALTFQVRMWMEFLFQL